MTTKINKRRLNKSARIEAIETIMSRIRETELAPKYAERDQVESELLRMYEAILANVVPAKEMKILKKHGAAEMHTRMYIHDKEATRERIYATFDNPVWMPRRIGIYLAIIDKDDPVFDHYDEFTRLCKELDSRVKELRSKVRTIVEEARFFGELLEIAPFLNEGDCFGECRSLTTIDSATLSEIKDILR